MKGHPPPPARSVVVRVLVLVNVVALVVFLAATRSMQREPSSSGDAAASLPATAARAARRLGAGARRAASNALPSCPPCAAAAAGASAGAETLEPGPGGDHPAGAFFKGKYTPYRDPTLHPLDWWATHAGLAAEAAAATAAAGTGGATASSSSSLALPPLPPRSYSGPLDVDAAAATRKAALDAAGVTGAPGAARGRRGYFLSYVETDPLYPFQRVRFADGSDSGVVALIAPFYDTNYFRAETQRALFWRLKARGHIIVGVSSYQEFPGDIVNPYDDRHVTPGDRAIHAAVDGWLHCFREPAKVLPPGVPRILLSESDFTDPTRRDGGGSLVPWGLAKQYDLIYSDQGGEWNDFARNWTLAVDCFVELVAKRNATIHIMGRDPAKEPKLKGLAEAGFITHHPPKTPWRDFLKAIEASRAIFIPNIHDASPRVASEALALDVPVLVNAHIRGGWKYATPASGAHFTSVADVVAGFDALERARTDGVLRPRAHFMETSGQKNAAVLFEAFLEVVVGRERMEEAAAVGKLVK